MIFNTLVFDYRKSKIPIAFHQIFLCLKMTSLSSITASWVLIIINFFWKRVILNSIKFVKNVQPCSSPNFYSSRTPTDFVCSNSRRKGNFFRWTYFGDVIFKAELSIQQWLKMEPALEQVIFVLMGGLAAIVVMQLFGASPPTALPAGSPTVIQQYFSQVNK